MRARRALVLYLVAAGAYLLDRATKLLVEATLPGRPPVDVIPGVLQLRFTTNPGGAFGIFGGAAWLFVLASVVVVVAIVLASRRLPSTVAAVASGLILGGAIGNLTDRAIRGPGFSGEVVDFIDFQVWPVFNVADSAIVVGVILMLLGGLRRRERATRAAEEG